MISQHKLLLGDQVGGLVAAVTLGARDSLDPAVTDLFDFLGFQHLLAPSGYHLGIFLVLLSSIFPSGFPRVFRIFLSFLTSVYLVAITVFPPSLVRAWVMWLFAMIGLELLRRPQPAILRLGAMLFVLLLIWPDGISTLSFQLSTAATLGIILFAPLVLSSNNFFLRAELASIEQGRTTLGRWRSSFFEYFWGTIVIGCIAQLAVLPLILSEFGSLQLLSPLSTLALAWFMPVLLFFGLLILLFSPLISFAPGLAAVVFTPIRVVLSFVWSLVLEFLFWMGDIFPKPLAVAEIPDWFSSAWWGTLLLLRLLRWLLRERKRTSKRQLL
ncbi:MAG: ComEC/Rec2 family competence protein [bacterium]|nr:ComEC/Rec2 family competence protein [bacterium]